MQMQLYTIYPELRPYIRVICTMECDEDTDTSHIRVLPDTCVEIFVNYTSTPVAIIDQVLHTRSIVTFRTNRTMDVQMRKGAGCVAICFHPGMAYSFFQIPMNELSNSTALLSDLWKAKTGDLEATMADAGSNEQRARMAQNFLLSMLNQNRDRMPMTHLLRDAQRTEGSMRVEKLCSITGYSQRQLSRKFQQHLGMSPAEYLRISRFIRSLNHLRSAPPSTLTELAYKSGYYDQAHFVRDCKNYTGLTPGALLKAKNILY